MKKATQCLLKQGQNTIVGYIDSALANKDSLIILFYRQNQDKEYTDPWLIEKCFKTEDAADVYYHKARKY